jgi:hypothetical protein
MPRGLRDFYMPWETMGTMVGWRDWCGRRDLNPQAFWALAPKASVFAISPLPHIASGSFNLRCTHERLPSSLEAKMRQLQCRVCFLAPSPLCAGQEVAKRWTTTSLRCTSPPQAERCPAQRSCCSGKTMSESAGKFFLPEKYTTTHGLPNVLVANPGSLKPGAKGRLDERACSTA